MIIGIIGGGQLGMMMAEEAVLMHHSVIGLDPNPKCPLSYVAKEIIVSDYNDPKAFQLLVSKCDVITYEFENVDLSLIERYQDMIPQKSDGLYFSRNRLVEKAFAKSLNIPTPRHMKFNGNIEYLPSILKTTTGGYDGKGQYKIAEKQDVDRIIINPETEYILEEMISFDYEISVVVTRDQYDSIVTYPIPCNKHRNGILHVSEVFNDIDVLIVSKATEYATKLIRKLDYVGTLAVEFFVKDENVIFNEFAPRPHNSGHYTIEGCTVSQFKNHIIAITGEKIEATALVGPTIMINVLGQDKGYVKGINKAGIYYHDYKKDASKVNRKMGHITVVSDTRDSAIKIMKDIVEE